MRSRVAFSRPPIEVHSGVRFPGDSYVRFPASVLPRDASYTGIDLQFRTGEPDALLFFAASPVSYGGVRQEYVVVQLRAGRPWFLFDPQNQATAVTTRNDGQKKYNDDRWHRLEVNRFDRRGFIELDGVYTGEGESGDPESTRSVIGVNDGVYVGGLPAEYNVSRPGDTGEQQVVRRPLVGCVKRIRVQHQSGGLGNWTDVDWDTAELWHRAYPPWNGCPRDMDRPAAHFLGRGFLEMTRGLEFGNWRRWTVEVRFRSDFDSGVLFVAFGGADDEHFIVATLNAGSVR